MSSLMPHIHQSGFSHRFFHIFFTHIDRESLSMSWKCTKKYLICSYAKFCSNMLITGDTCNAQSLNSACLTANAISPIQFLTRNTNLNGFSSKVIGYIITNISPSQSTYCWLINHSRAYRYSIHIITLSKEEYTIIGNPFSKTKMEIMRSV